MNSCVESCDETLKAVAEKEGKKDEVGFKDKTVQVQWKSRGYDVDDRDKPPAYGRCR